MASIKHSVRKIKTTSQTSYQDKNSPRYTNKWMKILTTYPAPHSEMPFTSGKGTNFSFTFSSRRAFLVQKSMKKKLGKQKCWIFASTVTLINLVLIGRKWFQHFFSSRIIMETTTTPDQLLLQYCYMKNAQSLVDKLYIIFLRDRWPWQQYNPLKHPYYWNLICMSRGNFSQSFKNSVRRVLNPTGYFFFFLTLPKWDAFN